MNIQSRLSGHWTDEQIVEHIYGVGPGNDHLLNCPQCSKRLLSMREHRLHVEEGSGAEEVSTEFLAAQRRTIYARLAAERDSRWSAWTLRRWASAGALALLLSGGLYFVEQTSQPGPRSAAQGSSISDSQLATEVSQMADGYEAGPTEPLQALFAE